jgi:uncharacterized protein RhaS with RHS repeats
VLPGHLGSGRQVIEAAGQVSLAQSYDPFGALISQSTNLPISQSPNPLATYPCGAQAGEWWDAEAELHYLRAL